MLCRLKVTQAANAWQCRNIKKQSWHYLRGCSWSCLLPLPFHPLLLFLRHQHGRPTKPFRPSGKPYGTSKTKHRSATAGSRFNDKFVEAPSFSAACASRRSKREWLGRWQRQQCWAHWQRGSGGERFRELFHFGGCVFYLFSTLTDCDLLLSSAQPLPTHLPPRLLFATLIVAFTADRTHLASPTSSTRLLNARNGPLSGG